jgi:uncharacterized damage-inducible protein DinB
MAVSECSRIADQLHRSYAGAAWHGPALNEILAGVTETQASRRPIEGAHTIHEIVLHITTWLCIARERMSAKAPRAVTPEEDWPPATGRWPDALAALDREVRALEDAIRNFPEDRLEQPAPAAEPQTCYVLFHGIVQHTLYHAGQIALLKK